MILPISVEMMVFQSDKDQVFNYQRQGGCI